MALRYWVGNSGNWSDTSHWSTSSGGASGASVPTISDDVIFDANSLSSNSSINLTNSSTSLKSFDSSSANYNITISKDASITIASFLVYGDFNANRVTNNANIDIYLRGTNSTITQTTPNILLNRLIVDATGVRYGSNFRVNSLTIYSGSFDTNNYSGLIGSINISLTNNAIPAYIYFRNSTIDVNNLSINTTSLVLDAGTSTLNISNSLSLPSGYYVYTVNFVGLGNIEVYGSNISYTNLGIATGKTVVFANASTQTVSQSLNIDNNVTMVARGGGSNYYNLIKPSGTVSVVGIKLKGSRASGGASFFADITSVDQGFNTGWVFAPPPPVASFNATPTSGIRPLTVSFTDTSTNGPTSWLWDFKNDGTATSTLQNPSYTYTTVGTYSVKLTATNDAGSGNVTRTALVTTSPAVYNRSASGTLLLSGGASRKLIASRSASGTLVLTGRATPFIRKDTDALEEKTYLYKVYDEDGSFIETWKKVISEPTYTKEINELGSTMDVELAVNSDSIGVDAFNLLDSNNSPILDSNNQQILTLVQSKNQVGPGSSINHNNRVDVIAFYGSVEPLLDSDSMEIMDSNNEPILTTLGAPNGRRIFTGFIAEINSRYGSSETTIVRLNSYGFDLSQFPYTTNTGDTTVPMNSIDPSDIAKQALTRFKTDSAAFGTYTDYTNSSILTTGTVVSYTFRVNTYQELLKKVIELMPSGWSFTIGLGDNLVYIRPKSATPNHVFYLGKHIKDLNLSSYIGNVVNDVLFVGGEVSGSSLYKRYTEPPAPRTRRGLQVYSDARVTLVGSADLISEGIIDENNNIQYRSTIEILTKQYDIESIEVGDVIGYRNFGNYVDALTMQVVGLTYTPDVVTLQLDTLPPDVNKRLEDLRRNLITTDTTLVPNQPTV